MFKVSWLPDIRIQ